MITNEAKLRNTTRFQQKCIDYFLDFTNNYLTLDYFAKCNNKSREVCEILINTGRECYNNRITVLHFLNRLTVIN